MRPDRFGKSHNHEFMESLGRERDHPYGSSLLARSVVASVDLTGFFGFEASNPTDPNGFPGTAGNITAYLANLSFEPRLFRMARLSDSNPIIGGRTLEWEFDQVVFAPDPISAEERAISGSYTPEGVASVTGAPLAQYDQTPTARNIRAIPGSGDFHVDATTVVSKPIDFAPWERLLRHHIGLVGDFPGAYQLRRRAGISDKDNPAEADFENYELGPGFGGSVDHSSLGVSQTYGFLPFPAAYSGSGSPALSHVVSGAMRITLVKVLLGTGPMSLPPLLTRAEWLVGNQVSSSPSFSYEIACDLARPAIEVLEPPGPEEIGESRIKMRYEFNGASFKSDSIIYRKFAFPGSAMPGAGVVGPLQPSCL